MKSWFWNISMKIRSVCDWGEKEWPSCMSWILVWSSSKFWWKRKTLLYVLNFGMVFVQIRVKKKDPPICPEFWYGQNSGEKERPPCMSLFDTVGDTILVKKKDPSVCPEFWYGQGTQFWWKRKTLLYVLNFGMVGDTILVKKKDPPVCPEFWPRISWLLTFKKFIKPVLLNPLLLKTSLPLIMVFNHASLLLKVCKLF